MQVLTEGWRMFFSDLFVPSICVIKKEGECQLSHNCFLVFEKVCCLLLPSIGCWSSPPLLHTAEKWWSKCPYQGLISIFYWTCRVRSMYTLVNQSVSDALETWLMWLWLLKVSLQNLLMLSPLLILRRVFTIGWWQLTAWQQLGMFGNNLSTAFQLSPTLSNIFRQNFGIACCGLFVSCLGRSRALNPWVCCAFGIVPL